VKDKREVISEPRGPLSSHIPKLWLMKFPGKLLLLKIRLKVFTSSDSFEPDRVENAAVAKIYFCKICGTTPTPT
jgi:hypothetical protein